MIMHQSQLSHSTLNISVETREVISWMRTLWPIKTIGPTIPSMYLDKRLEDDTDYGFGLFNPNADTCMKWLNSKEGGSVVYVSFGSMANLGNEQMEELVEGIKSSNCNFLWVVRESEVGKLPSKFAEETSEKGLVVNWCPQLEVLAHREVMQGEKGKGIKENSIRWRELAKEAVDGGGSSEKNIEEFVAELLCKTY
ncbi:hypothetical protein TIFTF001_008958 [Ficus carica]|uniref:Uncharacterized protein n=1 Tax=Ficus carica TaxID=3494 RepID=A0AA88AG18_FICCA|nr:hypothetical protein TIFTF001_008958 [Ficus carica]